MSKRKRIILAMPENFGLHKPIIENLTYYDFEVIPLTLDNSKYYFKNFRERVLNFIRITLFRDKFSKKKLLMKSRNIFESIHNITGTVEYALFIRADVFTEEILQFIKCKCKKMVGYQWDGMSRFPLIHIFVKYFDRFFAFESNKVSRKDSILNLTNFYFDYPIVPNLEIDKQFDIFYIGSYIPHRMDEILLLSNLIEKMQLKIKINILAKSNIFDVKYKNTLITFIEKEIPYGEYLRISKNCKIILDFQDKIHKGLSFRVFESLGFEKKLITNNTQVKEYDFYHPNNILVWECEDDLNQLSDFIKKPYYIIDSSIREKYSFKNWINYVLDIKPYVPINLP